MQWDATARVVIIMSEVCSCGVTAQESAEWRRALDQLGRETEDQKSAKLLLAAMQNWVQQQQQAGHSEVEAVQQLATFVSEKL